MCRAMASLICSTSSQKGLSSQKKNGEYSLKKNIKRKPSEFPKRKKHLLKYFQQCSFKKSPEYHT